MSPEQLDALGEEIATFAARIDVAEHQELEALERFLSDADLCVDASTNEPQWDGVPMDLADTLAWMLMADLDP